MRLSKTSNLLLFLVHSVIIFVVIFKLESLDCATVRSKRVANASVVTDEFQRKRCSCILERPEPVWCAQTPNIDEFYYYCLSNFASKYSSIIFYWIYNGMGTYRFAWFSQLSVNPSWENQRQKELKTEYDKRIKENSIRYV